MNFLSACYCELFECSTTVSMMHIMKQVSFWNWYLHGVPEEETDTMLCFVWKLCFMSVDMSVLRIRGMHLQKIPC